MAVPRSLAVVALAGLLALAAPVAARADDGEDVRVALRCTSQSRIELRVRTRDESRLRIELRVRTPQRGTAWSAVVVHERRIAWRAGTRTGSSSGDFSRRLTLPDWPGRDTIIVRAIGPRGEVCRASATVAGV